MTTRKTSTGTTLRGVVSDPVRYVSPREYAARRAGATLVAFATLIAAGFGIVEVAGSLSPVAGDSVNQRAQTLANRTAKAGEVCTPFYPNGANEPELIRADSFADGSEDIRGLAYDAAAMKNPAVCRSESSTDLGDNRAVPSEKVPEGQMVSPEEFAEVGGFSSDVG